MVVPDFPRACMPDLRDKQNQRPISTRNGSHDAANDIQSFMRNVSCFIAIGGRLTSQHNAPRHLTWLARRQGRAVQCPSWPGVVPAIHVCLLETAKTWMPGMTPGMTTLLRI